MDLLGSLIIAFAMYTRIPVPQIAWNENRMKYTLCFFPAVGLVIGGMMVGWRWLSIRIGISEIAFSAMATVLPLVITGGIHMDGFLDTVDARSSHLGREKKLEILKDPHAGAFAVIGGAVYLLCSLGLFCELRDEDMLLYSGCFVLSRSLSAWALVSWPKARKDGLANLFASQADTKRVKTALVFWIMAAIIWFCLLGDWSMCILCGVTVLGILLWYLMIRREFGGITGDLAGYFLQICELCLLAAVVIGGKIVI